MSDQTGAASDESGSGGCSASWRPINLDAVLSGHWEPVQPTVGERTDGLGVLYRGKVHTASSESEAGKTWFALDLCATEIKRGEHTAYLDFEDDEGTVVGRLLAMQVSAEAIRERFHYFRPEVALTAEDFTLLTPLLRRCSLVILDGVTEAMGLWGLDPLSNKDIATFGKRLPRPVAKLGPAVLALDHVVKDKDNRGRYSLGGVHKLNGLNGAAFILTSRTPITIGATGRSYIRVAKDRNGQLRKRSTPSGKEGGLPWFADLVVHSHAEEFVVVTIEPPLGADEQEAKKVARDDAAECALMERISRLLEEKGPLSANKIENNLGGNRQANRDARTRLTREGYLDDTSPFQSLRPYRVEVPE